MKKLVGIIVLWGIVGTLMFYAEPARISISGDDIEKITIERAAPSISSNYSCMAVPTTGASGTTYCAINSSSSTSTFIVGATAK